VFTLTALEPKEAEMRIIGVDLHARQQTVAMLDTKTGELIEKTLKHDGDEVRRFYSETNGFCERFHRTVKEEFYAVAFRKTFYESLEQLQRDLDEFSRSITRSAPTRAIAPRAALRFRPCQKV
jgi:hypothetical protein